VPDTFSTFLIQCNNGYIDIRNTFEFVTCRHSFTPQKIQPFADYSTTKLSKFSGQ